MVATKQEIIDALKGALDEVKGDRNVTVPVLFLQDVLEALEEEKKDG